MSEPVDPAATAANERRLDAVYVLGLVVCFAMGGAAVARFYGSGAPSDYLDAAVRLVPLVAGSVIASWLVAAATARLKKRPRIPGAGAAGLAFALTLPPDAAVAPAIVAAVFGWIVGREVFGKREQSFVHPAVLAHVFLLLTWPQALGAESMWLPPDAAAVSWTDWLWLRPAGGAIGASSAFVCVLFALILIALGRVPWRILASVPIGAAVGLGLLWDTTDPELAFNLPAHLLMGSVLFGVVFLATDSASSPSSKSGQWAFGMIIGLMIVLQRLANPTNPDGTLFAILVASVFAPLLDHATAVGKSRWRRRERG